MIQLVEFKSDQQNINISEPAASGGGQDGSEVIR